MTLTQPFGRPKASASHLSDDVVRLGALHRGLDQVREQPLTFTLRTQPDQHWKYIVDVVPVDGDHIDELFLYHRLAAISSAI